jgi:hypothetical protein
MLWKDYVGDTIRVAQQKTTTKLTVPLHDDLAQLLTLGRRETTTILSTVYKKPFSVKSFGNMVFGCDPGSWASTALCTVWSSQSSSSPTSRSGLFGKRDHGHHRTQDAR